MNNNFSEGLWLYGRFNLQREIWVVPFLLLLDYIFCHHRQRFWQNWRILVFFLECCQMPLFRQEEISHLYPCHYLAVPQLLVYFRSRHFAFLSPKMPNEFRRWIIWWIDNVIQVKRNCITFYNTLFALGFGCHPFGLYFSASEIQLVWAL